MHPKSIINNRNLAKLYTEDDLIDEGTDFLQEQAVLQDFCRDKFASNKKVHDCDCLGIFRQEEEADELPLLLPTAKYMLYFAKKPKKEQQMIVIEWMKYAGTGADARFLLPILVDNDEEVHLPNGIPKICRNALLTIIGYSRTFWGTLVECVTGNTLPSHGLEGRGSNNTIPDELDTDLFAFLSQIEELAEPTAMRFVREKTGELHTRDEEEDVLYLAPSFSKRSVYNRFCHERGWKVETNPKGVTKKVPRTDEQWVDQGIEPNETCHWHTFWSYWKKHFPNLRVRKPSADVCGDCHKFFNRIKFKSASPAAETETAMAEVGEIAAAMVPPEIEEDENHIEMARGHVVDAREMRKFANQKMKEAQEDERNDVAWSDRRNCLVVDYCQNMELPFFGASQPGDTYYLSPLGIFCLGVSNVGIEDHTLNAYIYHEGEGKKGGNNVASLLMKDITDRGWIDATKGPRKELTIIMDNCGGQNKNRMVLRLACLMVELKYFETVTFCFLVAGHTKNSCDRLFNSLKKEYRKSDVFSVDSLLEKLSVCENITPVRVKPQDFKDFCQFEDRIYKGIQTGTVNRAHIFTCTQPGVLVIKDTAAEGSHTSIQNLVKNAGTRGEVLANMSEQLQPIEPPGIADIKKVELFKHYRPFVPEPFQEELCPFPGVEIMEKIKNQKNVKRKQREELKKSSKKAHQSSK